MAFCLTGDLHLTNRLRRGARGQADGRIATLDETTHLPEGARLPHRRLDASGCMHAPRLSLPLCLPLGGFPLALTTCFSLASESPAYPKLQPHDGACDEEGPLGRGHGRTQVG